jgi:hypothetical protein
MGWNGGSGRKSSGKAPASRETPLLFDVTRWLMNPEGNDEITHPSSPRGFEVSKDADKLTRSLQ